MVCNLQIISIMKSLDIIILLKKTTTKGKNLNVRELASALCVSTSSISESLERCRIAQLVIGFVLIFKLNV